MARPHDRNTVYIIREHKEFAAKRWPTGGAANAPRLEAATQFQGAPRRSKPHQGIHSGATRGLLCRCPPGPAPLALGGLQRGPAQCTCCSDPCWVHANNPLIGLQGREQRQAWSHARALAAVGALSQRGSSRSTQGPCGRSAASWGLCAGPSHPSCSSPPPPSFRARAAWPAVQGGALNEQLAMPSAHPSGA